MTQAGAGELSPVVSDSVNPMNAGQSSEVSSVDTAENEKVKATNKRIKKQAEDWLAK
jgi:hypothetical protein